MRTGARRATPGDPHRPGAAPCRGLGPTRGWDPPLPCGHPSVASDAYKIIPDAKTLPLEDFTKYDADAVGSETKFQGTN